MKIAVLASGSGTILESIVASGLQVSLVVVDRPCRAEEVATAGGIDVVSLYRSDWGKSFDRKSYSEDLSRVLLGKGIELIAMAGFGTIVTEELHRNFEARILNTHPSLLPSFPGWHAVEAAIEFGVMVTGCTVHLATVEVDAGPILAQRAVEVFEDDTPASLHERIKEVERSLYPETIKLYNDFLDRGSVGQARNYPNSNS
ncbi:MAG: phosphoribosylglycinamide formyltransferase [Actinomycetota bacterium]|nr:phosphoribosylglycinamide formyltransferase [Actinomycetota bacterium]